MNGPQKLRSLLAQDRLILAPFTYDAFTARIAEAAGFQCIYMSGFGTSMSKGFPDAGLLTQTEMVQNARSIVQPSPPPLSPTPTPATATPSTSGAPSASTRPQASQPSTSRIRSSPSAAASSPARTSSPWKTQSRRSAPQSTPGPTPASPSSPAPTPSPSTAGTRPSAGAAPSGDAGADLLFVDGIQTADDLHDYAPQPRRPASPLQRRDPPCRRRREPRL